MYRFSMDKAILADPRFRWHSSIWPVIAAVLLMVVGGNYLQAESIFPKLDPTGGRPFSFRQGSDPDSERKGIEIGADEVVTFSVETSGPCAVYLSLITPSPVLEVELGSNKFEVPANSRFYLGVRETFPPFSTIEGGRLYGKNPSGPGQQVAQELFAGWVSEKGKYAMRVRPLGHSVRVAHLRLRPLTAEDLALLNHQNDPAANRRVIYNNDGFSGFGEADWEPQDLFRQIDRFRNTDAERLDVQTVSAGTVQYPSPYADFFGDGATFAREFEKNAAANFRKLEKAEMSLFSALARRGREIGLPVWGSVRVSAFYGEHPFGGVFNGRFWQQHPEFIIRRKNGAPLGGRGQLSFAFKEVSNLQLGQLVDLAERGCDGVTVDFLMPPVLGYDEPLIAEFQRRHGEDPRNLSDHDERWVALRCEVITQFMRELRQRLTQLEKKQDRQLGITARVPVIGYRELGFDPETWIKEGLVDMLVPGFPDSEKWYDVRPWVKMAKGSEVAIYGNIEFFIHETSGAELTDAEVAAGVQPGVQTTYQREDYLRRAAELYQAGVDGLYLYNAFMHDAPVNPSLNQIGDKTWIKGWAEFKDPAQLPSAFIKVES